MTEPTDVESRGLLRDDEGAGNLALGRIGVLPWSRNAPGHGDEDRWHQLDRRDQRSAQLRNKFDLNNSDDAEKITDWLTGTGAIPFTLIVLGLIVYAAITLIAGGA